MKDKSKIILVVAILAIAAIIAYVCYGALKGKKNPVATMEVSYIDGNGQRKTGTVKIELNPEVAPITVENFIQLANNGFYDGLTFHRIVTDFMIQGGDKQGTGAGSAKYSDLDKKVEAGSSNDYTYSIKGEFSNNGVNNPLKFEKGVIGMARSDYRDSNLMEEGYNSGSSQFFIVTTDKKSTLNSLNKNYTTFGKVIEGYEYVEEIANIYGIEEGNSEKLTVSASSENKEDEDSEFVKVTVTGSEELDSEKLPEGWTISADSKSISKEMKKGDIEKLTITSKDGDTVDYSVIAGEDNIPKINKITVDTFGAKYKIPEVMNFDEIQNRVYQYQSYRQQLMNSLSSQDDGDETIVQDDGIEVVEE